MAELHIDNRDGWQWHLRPDAICRLYIGLGVESVRVYSGAQIVRLLMLDEAQIRHLEDMLTVRRPEPTPAPLPVPPGGPPRLRGMKGRVLRGYRRR